jgi:hypothetical protein
METLRQYVGNARSRGCVAMAPRTRRLAAALLGLLSVAGCDATDTLPGTSLGTFAFRGAVTSNTCGASLKASDPWTFDVKVSKDGTTLFWKPGSDSAVSGILDANNKSTLTATTTSAVDGGSCVMARTDTTVLALDQAVPTAITGTLTLAFSASSTSDCSSQLSANGGPFQTVPCSVAYSFSAPKK